MKLIRKFATCVMPLVATAALAADFDGSRMLICATVSATDCTRGDDCASGLPEDVGAPAFMRVDFAKNVVIGPKHTTDILLMDKSSTQLILQGREGGFGWTMALDAASGEMTATLANRNGAYVWFGSCTPL